MRINEVKFLGTLDYNTDCQTVIFFSIAMERSIYLLKQQMQKLHMRKDSKTYWRLV